METISLTFPTEVSMFDACWALASKVADSGATPVVGSYNVQNVKSDPMETYTKRVFSVKVERKEIENDAA